MTNLIFYEMLLTSFLNPTKTLVHILLVVQKYMEAIYQAAFSASIFYQYLFVYLKYEYVFQKIL